MAMYRPYYVDSGLFSVSGTGILGPLLYFAPTATNDVNIIALVCSIEVAGTNPTAVSNSDLFFSLNVTTGTKAGGAAVTPAKIGPSALAANTVASSGTTPITGLTQSTEIWGHAVPYTAGAFTDQAWENTGREINLAASSTTAFYVSVPSGPGAGAGFNVRVEAWIAE
jgi:hypothetical protein